MRSRSVHELKQWKLIMILGKLAKYDTKSSKTNYNDVFSNVKSRPKYFQNSFSQNTVAMWLF